MPSLDRVSGQEHIASVLYVFGRWRHVQTPRMYPHHCPSQGSCFHQARWHPFVIDLMLKGRYNIGNVGKTASMSMLTLFESRYTLKGRYNIGNVGKTASMSMLTLFESRYTLKGRYNIGNVGKTASMSMLTLFEWRYTLKGRYNIGNVGKTASMSMLTLFEWIKIYIEGKVQHW